MFLVSGKSLLSQLNAGGPAGAEFLTPPRASRLELIADSPPFVKPVSDLKTDLRI